MNRLRAALGARAPQREHYRGCCSDCCLIYTGSLPCSMCQEALSCRMSVLSSATSAKTLFLRTCSRLECANFESAASALMPWQAECIVANLTRYCIVA
eukprot:1758198-Amphidinium_carterae.6